MDRIQNKGTLAFIICSSMVLSAPVFAGDVYKCTNEDSGHIALQDHPCGKNDKQTSMPLPNYKANDQTTSLRPQELLSLQRLHEEMMMAKSYHYETRSQAKLENQRFKNDVAFEELRHKHAKEMFDKSFRNFYTYGVANGEGSFPVGFSTGGYQGVNTGDVVNIDGSNNVQQGGLVGNQNN